jgi:hypothetical protein
LCYAFADAFADGLPNDFADAFADALADGLPNDFADAFADRLPNDFADAFADGLSNDFADALSNDFADAFADALSNEFAHHAAHAGNNHVPRPLRPRRRRIFHASEFEMVLHRLRLQGSQRRKCVRLHAHVGNAELRRILHQLEVAYR